MYRVLIILTMLLNCGIAAFGQYGTLPVIDNYTPDIYSSHNQNWGQVQTSNDIMYFANGDGLLEFDGTHWKTYKTGHTGSLLSVDIYQDSIFVGGIGEIGMYIPDSLGQYAFQDFTYLLPEEHADFGQVWFTGVFGDHVFFQTDQKVFRIRRKDYKVSVVSFNDKITTAMKVGEEFWVDSRESGLLGIFSDRVDTLDPNNDFNGMAVSTAWRLGENHFIIGTTNNGFFVKKDGIVKPWNEKSQSEFLKSKVNYMIRLSSGKFAIATVRKGLLITDESGNIIEYFGKAQGVSTPYLKELYEDRFGAIWASSNEGIVRINYRSKTRELQEGVSFEGFINNTCILNGTLYITTSNGIFACPRDSTKFKHIKNLHEQAFEIVDYKGSLIAAGVTGVTQVRGDSAVRIHTRYARALHKFETNTGIQALVVGGRNTVMLGEIEKDEFKDKILIEDFPDEVLHITQDYNRTDSLVFWLGLFNKGVAKLCVANDLGKYSLSFYSKDQGIPDGYMIPYYVNNQVYFVSKFEQIFNFDYKTDKFVKENLMSDMLTPGNTSYFLIENPTSGDIYLEDSGPISFLKKGEKGFTKDSISLSSDKFGYANDVCFDEKGNAYIGSEYGLIQFNPNSESFYDIPYQCYVRKVFVNGDSLLHQGAYWEQGRISFDQSESQIPSISYRNHDVVLHFVAPYYFMPEDLEYSHRLVGYREEFSKNSSETKANFTNLEPGIYTFEVKATNALGIESNVGKFSFRILPPWYRTYWAYTLYFVLGIILVYALLKLNSRRLQKANERLKLIIDQNTEEIRAQRDQVQGQRDLLEKKNNDILSSIAYAKRIQEGFLPTNKSMNFHLPNSFVFYKPKDIVSGDFYWMEAMGSKVFWAVVDCTGHGVPGALMSIVGSNGLRKVVTEQNVEKPSEILLHLTQHVLDSIHETQEGDVVRDGMDIALCCWDKATNKVEFAGAYNPLYLLRNGELTIIKGTKRPIGSYKRKVIPPFENHEIQAEPGDVIILFSDGFADQFGGPKESKYTYKRLRELILNNQGASMDEFGKVFKTEFENWKGGTSQLDDICVMGVKIE